MKSINQLNMRFSFTFFVILFFILSSKTSFAQLDTIHRIPPLHCKVNGDIEDHHIYLTTPKQFTFNVTITDGDGNNFKNSPYSISNSSSSEILVGNGQSPATKLMIPSDSLSKVLYNKGLVLEADYPFYANIRYRSKLQAGSLTAKGGAAAGTEFRVGPMPQKADNFRRNFVTSIQATRDSTLVKVKNYDKDVEFKSSGGNITSDSLSINLDMGETYVLSGYTNIQGNLDGFVGASITSNRPIVVNTGNFSGSIANSSKGQDLGADQIVPVDELGNKYASIEGNGPPEQERPMVLAAFDNTKVYVNGNSTASTTLNSGEWYLIPNNQYSGTNHNNMAIETSKPAYVYQFLAGNIPSFRYATAGLNFLAPLNCGLPKEVDIPKVEKIGNTNYTTDIIIFTKTGSNVKVNNNVHTNSEKLKGFPAWESYKISSNYSGNVTIKSDSPMAAGMIGRDQDSGYGGLFSGYTLDLEADLTFLDTVKYSEKTSGCFNDTIDVEFTGAREITTELKWDFGKASPINPPGKPTVYADSNTGPYQLLYDSLSYGNAVEDSVKVVINDNGCKDSAKKSIRIFQVEPGNASMTNISVIEDSVVRINFNGVSIKDLTSYQVMRKKVGSGGFQLAKEVVNPSPKNDTFTVYDTVNARSHQLCYSIKTVRSCKANRWTDTFCTTQLKGQPANLANKLIWDRFRGYSIDSQIIIRKKLSKNIYDTISRLSGKDSTYRDTGLPCNRARSYKVLSYEDGGDLRTLSDSVSITPYDTIPPSSAEIESFSVMNSDSALLKWKLNGGEVTRYELSLQASGLNGQSDSWEVIDTVGLDTSYIVDSLNTLDSIYCARIVALDSCAGNRSKPSPEHCAIQLEGSPGNGQNNPRWYSYKGYSNLTYEVQRLVKGTMDQWKDLGSTIDTSFIDSVNTPCNVTQTYRIRSETPDGKDTLYSDVVQLTPFDTVAPRAPLLRYASAKLDGTVELGWFWDTSSNQDYFEIWRQDSSSQFRLLDSVLFDSTYTDQSANAGNTLHQYYVKAADSCPSPNQPSVSDTDRLMVPELATGACQAENRLSWSPYVDLPQKTDQYDIYRKEFTSNKDFTFKASQKAQQTSFTDTAINDTTTYCYRIKALDTNSGYEAWSDSVCGEPYVYPDPRQNPIIRSTVTKTGLKGADNGAIDLTWAKYRIDTFAESYEVLHSLTGQSGSYQQLTRINNLDDTTYRHSPINSRSQQHYYKLKVENQCKVESSGSDNHRPINLSVENQSLSIALNWTPYQGFSLQSYDIQRAEVNSGSFQTIKRIDANDTSWIDSTVECDQRYAYRVKAKGFTQQAFSYSDTLIRKARDTNIPKSAEIEQLSIEQTSTEDGQISLRFLGSEDFNREGYYVYRKEMLGNNRNYQLIDSIVSQQKQIRYRDDNINTQGAGPYAYYLRSYDSCGNIASPSDTHQSIYLEAESGREKNEITWTAYKGWSVKEYEVYKGSDLMARVSGDQLSYIDVRPVCTAYHNYRVRAIKGGDTVKASWSNFDSAKAKDLTSPEPVMLRSASVVEPNTVIQLNWAKSKAYDADGYEVYREGLDNPGLEQIATLNDPEVTTLSDTLPRPLNEQLCYEVRVRDNCSNLGKFSNEGCVMSIEGKAIEGVNRINWEEYKDWPGNIGYYQIYKQEDSSLYRQIGKVDGETTKYKDEDPGAQVSDFCYQVKAQHGSGNESSRSFEVCLQQPQVVYIPNSFSPGTTPGKNDKFGPKGLYIENFEMQVFNRWGEQVFSTSDGERWDGTYNGSLVSAGIYMYIMTVTGIDGNTKYYEGKVTVVR